MFKLKYTFMTLLGLLMLASCSDEGSNLVSDIEGGNNIASFSESSLNFAQVADGTSEYEVKVPMQIEGPSVPDLTGDITVTVEPDFNGIDEDERAVEGTHFRIDSNEITLKASDNYYESYADSLIVTMLTEGLTAPLDESPKLNLKVTEVSGASNVVSSAKPIEVTLNYACPSNLQGAYDVRFVDGSGNTITYEVEEGVFEEVTYSDVEVTKTGIGAYTTDIIGIFQVGGSEFRPSNDIGNGLAFTDVCGELTVPGQTLGVYSNAVAGAGENSIDGDPETGDLNSFTLKYSVDGFGDYTAIYTKQ